MQSFKDVDGEPHDVNVTFATIMKVRSRTGIDLQEIIGPKSREIVEKLTDPMTFVEVLGIATGEDGEQLAEKLDGAAAEAAMNAVLDAVLDFFPPQKGKPIREALRRTREAADLQEKTTLAHLQEAMTNGDFDRALSKALSGNSPGNSESTLGPAHFES